MMKGYQETYWSSFARTYRDDQEYVVGKKILLLLLQQLSEEHNMGDVIEFGCGTGYFTEVIAKKAKHVIATDFSDDMLEIANMKLRMLQNVTIQRTDCEVTSFPSERFDTVFMANLLHILENPVKVLQESHQILRNGGVLLAIDFTGYGMSRFEKIKLGIRYLMKWGMPLPHSQNNLTPEGISYLLEKVDFSVEHIQVMGDRTKALYVRARK